MYKNRREGRVLAGAGSEEGRTQLGRSAGPARAELGLRVRRAAAAGLPLRADRSCMLGPARSDVPDRL